jgi:group I intron endonuclease
MGSSHRSVALTADHPIPLRRLSMLIYKITNIINKKVYIGQTVSTLRDRLSKHLRCKDLKDSANVMHAEMRDNPQNFIIEQVEHCNSKDELNYNEMYWIAYYKSNNSEFGYNMTHGGAGTIGWKHSEEAKDKMAKARIGKLAWNSGKKTGQIAWNKGLTADSDSRVKLYGEKGSRVRAGIPNIKLRGRIPWNKGLAGTKRKHQSIEVKEATRQRMLEYWSKRKAINNT